MFTIPPSADAATRAAFRVIQGELFKLAKRGDRVGGEGGTIQIITKGAESPSRLPKEGGGLPTDSSGDVTIHGDLYIDGTIHGGTAATISNIDPTFADVTGSRVLGTTYQNTETTMKMVVISVELSG